MFRATPTLGGRRIGVAAAAAALAALAAGCAGAIPGSHGSPGVTVANGEVGRFLADGNGHSLYLFTKDEEGESDCDGACASVWPPYEVYGAPTAAAGLGAGKLGTIRRDDGDLQVTYAGHPLYFYAGDAGRPGSTDGEGLDQFGAEWYLVAPTGETAESGEGDDEGGGS